MAVIKRPLKSGTSYRVNWRNPFTGKVEFSHKIPSLKEARRYDDEVKLRLKHDPESFRPVDYVDESSEWAVSGLLKQYFDAADITSSTRRSTFYHIKAIVPLIGHIMVKDLSKKDMRAMERHLRDSGVKQNTVQRRVSILRAALNWAIDQELIENNPLLGYRCPRGPDLKLPAPTTQEIQAILDHAPPHLERAIYLGYGLGVRIGESELFRIRWDGVDFANRNITFQAADKNKNVQWRQVDLSDDLFALLKKWRAEDEALDYPWIIHFRGKPIRSMKMTWATTKRKAGITRRMRPYDLRHAFATHALLAGSDLKAVSEVMGHASTVMIHRHYQHVLNRQKRAVVNSIQLPKKSQDDQAAYNLAHKEGQTRHIFVCLKEKE